MNEELLEETLKEFALVADDWFEKREKSLNVRLKYFKDNFSHRKLEKFNINDIENLSNHLNGRFSRKIVNFVKEKKEHLKEVRDKLSILINMDIDIHEKLRSLRSSKGIKFIGTSYLTEMLTYYKPEYFSIYNKRTKDSFVFFDIEHFDESEDNFSSEYTNYNNYLLKKIESKYNLTLKNKINLPINIQIDQFFSWVTENKKIEIINKKVEKINREILDFYFCLLSKIIKNNNLSSDNSKIRFNNHQREDRNDFNYSFFIGSHTCLSLKVLKKNSTLNYLSTSQSPETIKTFTNLYKHSKDFSNEFRLNKNSITNICDDFQQIIDASKILISAKQSPKGTDPEKIDFRNFVFSNINTFKDCCNENKISDTPDSDISDNLKSNSNNQVGKIVDITNCKDFSKNQILYGPPGTGKTYNTIKLAAEIIKCEKYPETKNADEAKKQYDDAVEIYKKHLDDRIKFVTFHQNFSYEDFVQGLRPKIRDKNDSSNEDKSLQFEKNDGVFKSIADEASKNLHQSYVLIIDEINRANISRVFGELITLIEDDKRWDGGVDDSKVKWEVTLPSGEQFVVPDNLYIIGTMNTADKSIALLDVALRRRFVFKGYYPLYDGEKGIKYKNVYYSNYLKKLNELIVKELKAGRGHDLQIGHSYFMHLDNDKDFIKSMNEKVIPLLMEYLMNDMEKVKDIILESLKFFSDKFELEKIGTKNDILDYKYPLTIIEKTITSSNDVNSGEKLPEETE